MGPRMFPIKTECNGNIWIQLYRRDLGTADLRQVLVHLQYCGTSCSKMLILIHHLDKANTQASVSFYS